MADIVISCTECGKQRIVSDSADHSGLFCSNCGAKLMFGARPRKKKLSLRQTAQAPQPQIQQPSNNSAIFPPMEERRADALNLGRRRMRSENLQMALIWVGFVALSGVLAYLRFGMQWPPTTLETIKLSALITLGVGYVVVIALALGDNMFDALLSLIVPFYAFYYLFCVSNAVWLRLLMGCLLLVFGYDTMLRLQALTTRLLEVVNHWIQNV